ncbi:MAG TPA: NnrS family protein [Burkholderiales bacterium]|nr:NnrS family protein [Burkholderiales bacterium]
MWSAGFRPFFLGAAAWAAIAVPVWLAAYVHGYALRGMPALFWHGHEMVYGFGLAAVAGFLLTAIPNWTGRLPVRGLPLALLAALWLAGRIAMLVPGAALLDLAFAAALIVVVARELIAGRNWRNLPMLIALALLFASNLLFHLGIYAGLRLGIATLLMLIALVGGRIVPSFTRNWLAKQAPRTRLPAPESAFDRGALLVTLAALGAWVFSLAPWLLVAAGIALAVRLARWRGYATLREPLLFILHVGYAWLALGMILLGLEVPAALHALTVGAVGTMTLAVMTRASLGHSGRALVADGATRAIYVLITLAALLRVLSPLAGAQTVLVTSLAGLAWSAAFATFALHYGRFLVSSQRSGVKSATGSS